MGVHVFFYRGDLYRLCWGLDLDRVFQGYTEVDEYDAMEVIRAEVARCPRNPLDFGSLPEALERQVRSAGPIDAFTSSMVRLHRARKMRGLPPQERIVDLRDLAEPSTGDDRVTPTWFELRLVDEIGEGIAGTTTTFRLGSTTREVVTDANGRARAESPEGASFSAAHVADLEPLRRTLAERWKVIRKAPKLESTTNHTSVTLSGCAAGKLVRERLSNNAVHTFVLHPEVVLLRFRGAHFQLHKSFFLANSGLQKLASYYTKYPDATLLVVGHTDTSGDAEYNDTLALERAESVAAYLRGEVEPWLDAYTDKLPIERRWGATEDRLMLNALLAGEKGNGMRDRVRHFQRTRGLVTDGKVGPETRRALVTEYMALHQAAVPEEMTVEVHGCGEYFPLVGSDDPPARAASRRVQDATDRRVELFVFADGLGVLPPPAGRSSREGATEYPEWLSRVRSMDELPGPSRDRGRLRSVILRDSIVLQEVSAGHEVLATDTPSKGAVRRIRYALELLGHDEIVGGWERLVSDAFDSDTEQKVRSFQRQHELSEDGIVDRETLHAIDDALLAFCPEV